ncbi:MAG: YCF48-related protein [Thermoplasmata archaeon]
MRKIKTLLIGILLGVSIIKPSFSQTLPWQHTGGPMGGVVGDMALDNDGNLWVGVYGWINIAWTEFKNYGGVYKTTDNGNSWQEITTPFEPFDVHALHITKAGHIFVGTRYQGSIYRSTDNGMTWVNSNNGYTNTICMAFGESKEGVLFAGDGRGGIYRSTNNGDYWQYLSNFRVLAFATDSNNTIWCGTFSGLYKSTDLGLNWTEIPMFMGMTVSSLLIDGNNNIFAGTGYYSGGMGVFHSKDNGQTWTNIGLETNIVLSLAMDSNGKLYAGTAENGLFSTSDYGKNWTQHLEGIKGVEVFRIKINSQNYIFIGSENEGVFRSTNGGDAFELVGLPISYIQNIEFSPDGNYIFASTPNGVQRFDRTKRIWEYMGLKEIEYLSISSTGVIYAATYNKGVYKSTNNGKTWNLITDQRGIRSNFKVINDSILIDVVQPKVLISRDYGVTWDTTIIGSSPEASINFDDNKIFIFGAYNNQSYVFYTNNFFQEINRFLAPSNGTSKNGLFVMGENIFISNTISNRNPGIYFCKITNQQWVIKLSGVFKSILIDSSNIIYIGGKNGILRSTDNGNSWEHILSYNRLGFIAQGIKRINNTLFIATNGYGLFELPLQTNVEQEGKMLKEFLLYQNYPNPFNPTTKIKYSVKEDKLVTIKLYDMLGREVATLLNEVKSPGDYVIELDAQRLGLSSGVYLYQMKSGEFSSIKKLVFVK